MKSSKQDKGLSALGTSYLLGHLEAMQKASKGAHSGHDTEAVHDMRVASRRIRSGLIVFGPCFKPTDLERWRKAIKGVTKVLGDARDTDVQIGYLEGFLEKCDDVTRPGVEALLQLKKSERDEVQEQVNGWLDNLYDEGSLKSIESRLSRIAQDMKGADIHSQAAFSAGEAHASARIQEILELEQFVHDPEQRLKHHALRIAAKKLRYTIEAFKPLFDDGLKKEIDRIKGLQDLLGDIHDCDVWHFNIDELSACSVEISGKPLDVLKPGLDAVIKDREAERSKLYDSMVSEYDRIRSERFFERLIGRFQSGRSTASMITEHHHEEMGKLAIVSDVHGNYDALRSVMQDAAKNGVTGYLNLGDMVGYGAYPEEVVTALSSDNVLSISGNFDLKVVEFARTSAKPRVRSVKRAVVAVAARDLSNTSIDTLASLPPEIRLEIQGKRIVMVHASPLDPDEHLGPGTTDQRLAEIGKAADSDIILIGHSHLPFTRTVNGVMFLNPGSVGRPVDHDPRAAYALLDVATMQVEMKRVDYDVEKAAQAVLDAGLPHVIADMLKNGMSSDEALGERKTKLEDKQRSLETFSQRLNVDQHHPGHVQDLALQLYMGLHTLHGLGGKERFILEAGCMLHDIGLSEGGKGHNRTSYRLIMEAKELPLDTHERLMVACLARYHRKRLPMPEDEGFAALSESDQKVAMKLISILRVADGLDNRHAAAVKKITCQISDEEVILSLSPSDDIEEEKQAAIRKGDAFEITFGRRLRIE